MKWERTGDSPSPKYDSHFLVLLYNIPIISADVSPSHFAEIEHECDTRRGKFWFRRSESESRILIIPIPTRVREQLHLGLVYQFDGQVRQRGIDDNPTYSFPYGPYVRVVGVCLRVDSIVDWVGRVSSVTVEPLSWRA